MGYIIAFDDIDGTATGIAVNAVSNQQVSVPVTVRNDAGAVLTKDTITLPPSVHCAFTLGMDRFQNISNILNLTPRRALQSGRCGFAFPPVPRLPTPRCRHWRDRWRGGQATALSCS
jgi:hypothetical protein